MSANQALGVRSVLLLLSVAACNEAAAPPREGEKVEGQATSSVSRQRASASAPLASPTTSLAEGQTSFPPPMVAGRVTYAFSSTGQCPGFAFPSSISEDGKWVVGLLRYGSDADCISIELAARRRRSDRIFKRVVVDGAELSDQLHGEGHQRGVAYVEGKVREMNAFLSESKLRPLVRCRDLTPQVDMSYRAQTVRVRRGDREIHRALRPAWQRRVEPRCRSQLHASVDAFCDLSAGLIVASVGFSGGGCKHPPPTLEVEQVPRLREAAPSSERASPH